MNVEQKVAARFWSKVDKSGDCWIWKAGTTSDGYGACNIPVDGKQKSFKAPRLAYILTNGELTKPELHHKCGTKLCVRPDHLEPMTCKEHMNATPGTWGYKWANRTHCDEGHLLEGDNLVPALLKKGYRHCRICANENSRAWRAVNPEKMKTAVNRWTEQNSEYKKEKDRERMRKKHGFNPRKGL